MLADFFQTLAIPANQIVGYYDTSLIILSYFVAVFSSYIALDLVGRLRVVGNSTPVIALWLIGGGFAMGAGIWSMHFIGMLAFSLPHMPMYYDFFWTGLSLLVAILASCFALALLTVQIIKPMRLFLGGVVLGLAIATMHYLGMQGMTSDVHIHYLPTLFALSILIAIVASELALWLALKSNQVALKRRLPLKIFSALIMGAAICGMHYVGMAAAIFTPTTLHTTMMSTLDPEVLAIAIAGVTLIIMSIFMASSYIEKINLKNTQIAEATAFLNNILESSIEYSIIALDLEGTILTWNAGAKQSYGYEAHEMVGKETIKKLQAPADLELGRFQNFLDTVLREGKAEGVFKRLRKNGEAFIALVTITLRRDTQDKPLGYLLISKDITEQKRLEEQIKINQNLDVQNKQIQETNRLKNEFLANMSHELRTPLNAIIGFSELMYDQGLGSINNEQKEGLSDVIKSSKLLLEIISDLLDLAKVESGKMEFSPQKINIEGLVREVLANVQMLFEKKRINLTAEVEQNVANVYLDPSRLKQVLYNLISNAHKFTPEFGSVQVRVKHEMSNFFRLEVEDNGIGISPKDINKLFRSFTQLEAGVNRKYRGTGLGLALTKQIVEAQGGRVGVSSTLGKGSLFYAVLPKEYYSQTYELVTVPRGVLKKAAKSVIERTLDVNSNRKHKVIVIDDDLLSLKLLKQWLKEKNYSLSCFSDPKLGLEAIITQKPDVVVLDLFMPLMNGFELLRQLNHEIIDKPIPIVIWTAKDLSRSESEMLDPSVRAVVLKGMGESTKEVMRQVEKILETNKSI